MRSWAEPDHSAWMPTLQDQHRSPSGGCMKVQRCMASLQSCSYCILSLVRPQSVPSLHRPANASIPHCTDTNNDAQQAWQLLIVGGVQSPAKSSSLMGTPVDSAWQVRAWSNLTLQLLRCSGT